MLIMGYDLHITRSSNCFEKEPGKDIGLNEWLVYVEGDPEMRRDDQATATTNNGKTLTVHSRGLSVWTKYPESAAGAAWFDHRDGRIVVKDPTEPIIQKMREIAKHFDARVQGDEGELYDSDTTLKKSPSSKKPWWKVW